MLLSLTGLFTLAVTQPLFDLIGRNVAFLVAHDIGRRALLLLTVGVAFGVPLAFAALVWMIKRAQAAAAALLHLVLIAAFTAAAVLVLLRVGGSPAWLPGVAGVVAAALLGAVVAASYRRTALLRRGLDWSAVAAPVVVVLFLVASPARGILLPTVPTAEALDVSGPLPDVVLVIFDELPLASLLDENREVDRATFPAFGDLARDATFFRNVTASHSSTVEAIPALLSGRYSDVNALPTAAAHPTNIFTLLQGTYRAHAFEPLTSLCSTGQCRDQGSKGTDWPSLLRDVSVLQRHLMTPEDLAGGLPPLDEAWRDFGDTSPERLDRDKFLGDAIQVLREDTPADFRRFLRSIKPTSRPALHVLHTLLPHRPWRYLPDGRLHGGTVAAAFHQGTWIADEWRVTQAHQLHFAQLQLADRLLGELIGKLRREGLYDDAAVVVVADHGVSLAPGTPPRDVTRGSLPEILPVPFFVKAPGQQQPAVSDHAFETIDVLPTVLDVLGVAPPANLDGRSALAGPPRSHRKIVDAEAKAWTVGASQEALSVGLDRKFDRFGTQRVLDFFRLAPDGHEDLLGRRVPRNLPVTPDATVRVDKAGSYRNVRPTAQLLRAMIRGDVKGPAGDTSRVLAVAVNGTIEAVTLRDPGPGSRHGFRAVVRPEAFRPGRNDIDVLHVGATGELTAIAGAR